MAVFAPSCAFSRLPAVSLAVNKRDCVTRVRPLSSRLGLSRRKKVVVSATPEQDSDQPAEGVSGVQVAGYIEPVGRRTTVVRFTCNRCQGQTERMCSPRALKKGSVFVQCQQCEAWHLIADNLNVAEEYRRGENGEWVRWVPDPLPEPSAAPNSAPASPSSASPSSDSPPQALP